MSDYTFTTMQAVAQQVAARLVSNAKQHLSQHVDDCADHAAECTGPESCGAHLDRVLEVQRILAGQRSQSTVAIEAAATVLLNLVACRECGVPSTSVVVQPAGERLCVICHSTNVSLIEVVA